MAVVSRPHFNYMACGHVLELGRFTRVMGILNATPDSFSGDGLLARGSGYQDQAFSLADSWVKNGASIIDIGGESTRPGAKAVTASVEIDRICPLIERVSRLPGVLVSADTCKTEVAHEAIKAGAAIINVVQGARVSATLLKIIKKYEAGLILMHMRGTPRTMQQQVTYGNLLGDIVVSLKKSVDKCLLSGINSESIIVDPGICFAKTAEQNLRILHDLHLLHELSLPILIGTSRKSFIGHVLNKGPQERLMGTAATVVAALFQGAHIVRVHDVLPITQLTVMADAIANAL